MKLFPILVVGTLPLAAQDIAPKDTERDPVLAALLEAPEALPDDGTDVQAEAPVLVTGKPPEDVSVVEFEPVGDAEEDLSEDSPADPIEIEAPEPQESLTEPAEPSGVTIAIEGGTTAGRYDADQVKLLAPFPAKPLVNPPAGWKIVQPEGLPAFSETAELPNGTKLALSIRPHLLVPDADGSQIFALSEPGFDPSLAYAQAHTIGSVLADSIHALDQNGDRLDAAAGRLSELLDSLPASPTPEEAAEETEDP